MEKINQIDKNEASAILSIDIKAVAENWLSLKAMLGEGSSCAAVVKSDAYGLGASYIASSLQKAGCENFFVAYLSEGIELRQKLGASANIFVLHGPFAKTEESFDTYNLIPVLNTLEQIENWLKYSIRVNKRLSAALHFDTGMSRLALSAKDQSILFNNMSDKLKALNVVLVMSHLANADEKENPKNQEQLLLFRQIKENITNVLDYQPKFSLSATAGMLLGQDYFFDLTRPGCGLYGFYPAEEERRLVNLKNVITLSARILQVQEARYGQSVGYGSTYQFSETGKIATAALGYADGFKRALGNSGYGYIAGYKVPVVGRVSMDLTTFNVSEVPEDVLATNSFIEVIGEHIPLFDIAEKAGTVAYDIVTNMGKRYCRSYVNELFDIADLS